MPEKVQNYSLSQPAVISNVYIIILIITPINNSLDRDVWKVYVEKYMVDVTNSP